MNSTSFNNLTIISSESWFIPVNIIVITCLALTMTFTSSFFIIIVLDKTCHTVRMMLVANIYFTGFICSTVHFIITVFTLYNDLYRIQYQDSFCVFRGYLSYTSFSLHIYSYLLSAIYQYVSIVYPTRLFWKSTRVYIGFIVISWIVAIICPLPFTLTGQIIYNGDNQICQVPLRFSITILYIPLFLYIIPGNLIVFIYMKLVRYVKKISNHTTLTNTMIRTQRDLKMVRRIVILIHLLSIAGFPLSVFIFLSFANLAPKYHFRLGFLFAHGASPFVTMTLFQFTDSLKTAVKKLIYHRRRTVIPAMTIKHTMASENKTNRKRINDKTQCDNIEIPEYRRVIILSPK